MRTNGVGPIVLVGGNEFRENCVPMDRAILARLGDQPRVVVVPTAAAQENPDLAASHGVRYFAGLGARATVGRIVTRYDANDPTLVASLHDTDLVYLTGGNPWYLLETLRDTATWATIRALHQDGRAIAGSSAGAMILAEQMVRRDRSGWLPALGLASGIAVLPHHRGAGGADAARLRGSLDPSIAIFGIAEATAAWGGGDGRWQVEGIGQVTVVSHSGTVTYGGGESFGASLQ